MKKFNPTDQIFVVLEKAVSFIPSFIYWKDKNSKFLGANKFALQALGYKAIDEIVGKTDYDIWPTDFANRYIADDNEVMRTGKIVNKKDTYTTPEGKLRYCVVTKAPLYNEYSKIVGVIGSSIDITAEKEAVRLKQDTERQKLELEEQAKFKKFIDQAAHDTQFPLAILLMIAHQCSGLKKEDIFKSLKDYTAFLSINIYWIDKDNRVVGANERTIAAIGGISVEDYIGKTVYDFYPYEMAYNIIRHNNEVMKTGKVLAQEEPIKDVTTGQAKYFHAFKAPLYDNTGNIIGLVGTSTDITAEKEAEYIKLENERQAVQLMEQEKFKQVANQMAHDIRSPLTSLSITYKAVAEYIPETPRIAAREAMIQLTDIANNLLNYDKSNKKDLETEDQQPIIVSLILSQVFSDKKHQNKYLDIKFTDSLNPTCTFAVIKAQPTSFKRMMSNLFNNAVEALGGKKGIVHLDLDLDTKGDNIKIVVQDSGKGMPQEVIDKILHNVQVATDKKEGHGIGLTQIQETLEHNQGQLSIESKPGEGTKMILTFPTIEVPSWLAKAIKINRGDTVVILDDDRSIHGAWDIRFTGRLNEVTVKHFMIGSETIDFINGFPEKEKIFLLTDFELLKQKMDGINVIEKTGVKKAILVTSHYAEAGVCNRASNIGIKILPKQLALDIPLEICEADEVCTNLDKPKAIDIVIIDDNQSFITSLELLFKNYNKTVDKYIDPMKFLDEMPNYNKDTKIFMDNDFGVSCLNGVELAERLHNNGFANLYLLSGAEFEKGRVPEYIIVILKTDIDRLCEIVDESNVLSK